MNSQNVFAPRPSCGKPGTHPVASEAMANPSHLDIRFHVSSVSSNLSILCIPDTSCEQTTHSEMQHIRAGNSQYGRNSQPPSYPTSGTSPHTEDTQGAAHEMNSESFEAMATPGRTPAVDIPTWQKWHGLRVVLLRTRAGKPRDRAFRCIRPRASIACRLCTQRRNAYRRPPCTGLRSSRCRDGGLCWICRRAQYDNVQCPTKRCRFRGVEDAASSEFSDTSIPANKCRRVRARVRSLRHSTNGIRYASRADAQRSVQRRCEQCSEMAARSSRIYAECRASPCRPAYPEPCPSS